VSRRHVILGLVVAAAAVGAVLLLRPPPTPPDPRCEACMEFEGRVECRGGTDATEAGARTAAIVSACHALAAQIESVPRCATSAPLSIECSAPGGGAAPPSP
jgi:hypothetical protein